MHLRNTGLRGPSTQCIFLLDNVIPPENAAKARRDGAGNLLADRVGEVFRGKITDGTVALRKANRLISGLTYEEGLR